MVLSLVDLVQRWISEPPPDFLFEITESALAGANPQNPSESRQEMFIERSLQASPSSPNLLRPQYYRDALPRLAKIDRGKRSKAALIIPDYAVRMALFDFEELPSSDEERAALVRFRMRKSVPFPIEEAQVSYSIQASEPKRIDVLAVAIARPILSEYEELFTSAGFRLGLVTPSSIAALPLCYSAEPGLTLIAKAAGSTVSVIILEKAAIRLARCLDLAGTDEDGTVVEEEEGSVLPLIQQTLAYAEDQLGKPVKRLLFCGFGAETEALGMQAEMEFGIPYAPVRSKFGAASQANAGLLGMLEQYAA